MSSKQLTQTIRDLDIDGDVKLSALEYLGSDAPTKDKKRFAALIAEYAAAAEEETREWQEKARGILSEGLERMNGLGHSLRRGAAQVRREWQGVKDKKNILQVLQKIDETK